MSHGNRLILGLHRVLVRQTVFGAFPWSRAMSVYIGTMYTLIAKANERAVA